MVVEQVTNNSDWVDVARETAMVAAFSRNLMGLSRDLSEKVDSDFQYRIESLIRKVESLPKSHRRTVILQDLQGTLEHLILAKGSIAKLHGHIWDMNKQAGSLGLDLHYSLD